MTNGHIAVDLDGTLAYYDHWRGADHIGPPIPVMLERVKRWLKSGIEVKIFTARASTPECIPPIQKWLQAQGLPELEITCKKGFDTIAIWDDRAVGVFHNTGIPKLFRGEPDYTRTAVIASSE